MVIIRKSKEEVINETDPLDVNKTEITHKLTALATVYLSNLGCKPIETEVCVRPGWIADVASFTYPTMTEMKNSKMLSRFFDGADEMLNDSNTKFEYFCRRYGSPITVLAEVKTTKSDYQRDYEKKFSSKRNSPAHVSFLVIPKSLEDKIELPLHWGRLICSESGSQIMKIHVPYYIASQHPGDIVDFVAQVAIRRDHRTAYRALRDMMKSYRAKRRK